mgnify:CR=1 FL=1|jgi:hypothetical protein
MNIIIPRFIGEAPEGAKLLVAFLYKLTRPHGLSGTRYFLDANDARTIAQKYMIDPSHTFSDYKKWIRIGKASDTHWFFEWQFDKYETEFHEIKKPELKQVWTFLIARLQGDPTIVEDWTANRFPTRQRPFLKKREDQQVFWNSRVPRPPKAETEAQIRKEELREAKRAAGPRKPTGRPPGSKNKKQR